MNRDQIEIERGGVPGSSELHRIMACPGSISAIDRWPKRAELEAENREALSKAAKMGTATSGTVVHQALETMEYIIDGETIEMDLSMAQRWMVDKCAAIIARISAEVFSGEKIEVFPEKRLFMLGTDGKPILSGKSDRIDRGITKIKSGTWLITDYKTGYKPVPAATNNWQIHANALCLENSASVFKDFFIAEIYGVIIQPLVTLLPTVVRIDPATLNPLRRQVRDRLAAAKLEGQPRIPGEHCAFCPVSHICFEAQTTGVIAEKKFSALGHLTPAQLTELHKLLPMITAKVDQIRDYIKEQLAKNPADFPTLQLKEVGNGFDVPDKIKLLNALLPVITKEEYRDGMKVPIAGIREVWVKRVAEAQEITQVEALAQWKDRIEPLLVPKPKKLLIAPRDEQPTQIPQAS